MKSRISFWIGFLAIGAASVTACNDQYGVQLTGPTSNLNAAPVPQFSAVPNGPNSGIGLVNGQSGAGNMIVFGDEWVLRLGDDSANPIWVSAMQSNLTNFWNDALAYLTANSPQKRVLVARFNNSGPGFHVLPPSKWATYLPNLDSGYTFHDYNAATDGTLNQAFLSNYDAFIFVSYDPMLSADLLNNFVQSGGSVMALPIGFGVPSPVNSAANYECPNMNLVLSNFPYKFDCGNPHSNFSGTGIFGNVDAAAIPFNNGYAVIPVGQAETPY